MNGEKNYTVEELAEIIVDSILQEKMLNKKTLVPIVTALIKTIVDLKNVPRNYNAYESKSKQAKRLRTIEQKECELKFWLNMVRKLDPNNMQRHYDECLKHLIEKGFRFPQQKAMDNER